MNKSIFKSDFTKLMNNLTEETSVDFVSQINQNLNKNMFGGGCHCPKALEAFNEENYKMALYILSEHSCCLCCKDANGNTTLHHLVLCCTIHNNSSDCLKVLNKVLSCPVVLNFINIQNNDGTTPILLAVQNGNEFVAECLDNAGADKSIADNDGNYLGTEQDTVNLSDTPNEQACVNNVINLFIDNKKPEQDLTSLNLGSVMGREPSRPVSDMTSDSNVVRQQLVNAFGLGRNVAESPTSLGLTTSENFMDSDKFIQFLGSKFQRDPPESIDDLLQETEILVDTETLLDEMKEKVSKPVSVPERKEPEQLELSDSVKTDALMSAIENIGSRDVRPVDRPMEGGSKQKVMGYRKLNIHSENSDNILERVNENDISKTSRMTKYSKTKDLPLNLDLYYSDAETGGTQNELSRLINSRKNELHNEVINMIMGMLNNGTITRKSKPIEATEKNAKLIKSYLYRIVSEKNPQLTGMDKILIIKKMSEKEIIEMLTKMPDLADLEETIRKHIEQNRRDNYARFAYRGIYQSMKFNNCLTDEGKNYV